MKQIYKAGLKYTRVSAKINVIEHNIQMENGRYPNFAFHYCPTRRADPGGPNKNIHEDGTDTKV
jgi:hypothetical protein